MPALYVRYEWPLDCGAVVTTPLVEALAGPLGGPHTSVKWLHCMHLPLLLQQHANSQQQQQLVVVGGGGASGSQAAGGGAAAEGFSKPGPVNVLFQVRSSKVLGLMSLFCFVCAPLNLTCAPVFAAQSPT